MYFIIIYNIFKYIQNFLNTLIKDLVSKSNKLIDWPATYNILLSFEIFNLVTKSIPLNHLLTIINKK